MSNTDFEYNFYIGYFKVGFTEYFTWLRRILYLASPNKGGFALPCTLFGSAE